MNDEVPSTSLGMESPVIGLTAGDLAGVGPEILEATLKKCEENRTLLKGCRLEIIGQTKAFQPGYSTRIASQAAIDSLEEAAQRLLSGELAAVVTGPVNKHALHQEGFPFPGQTEFFAARAGVKNFAMLLTGGLLTVALVTTHIPLKKVETLLKTEEIFRVGKLLFDFLKRRGIHTPRIAVAGLNPHAGENGDMGDEEEKVVFPAIQMLNQDFSGSTFIGPMSPDTIFWRAVQGEFDAVLCMYHDQGLIPLKLHAFHEGVNVTLGLPFIRTSPDHGTAYELAGKGTARYDSYLAALKLAVELVSKEKLD